MKLPKPTRTLNPLHFEDLDPHRFEDLIRQLIYDLRDWSSIEGLGRAGAEEGYDIRAWERLPAENDDASTDEDEEHARSSQQAPREGRLWMIQCKREGAIGPARVRKIVGETFDAAGEKPRCYALVAPCDFSKKSRDVLRGEMSERKVEEWFIWGKAELEDRLFLPRYDHLLFAYFGVSLQVRRRSIRAEVRRDIALKRALIKVLGPLGSFNPMKAVLIRDPSDSRYPFIDDPKAFLRRPAWRYLHFFFHMPPGHVAFVTRRYFAWADFQTRQWDALMDHEWGPPHPELYGIPRTDGGPIDWKASTFWSTNVPRANQAHLVIVRFVPYERILAVDEDGDAMNEGPHLLVAFENGSPFTRRVREYAVSLGSFGRKWFVAEAGSRKAFFPTPLPDEPPDPKGESKP